MSTLWGSPPQFPFKKKIQNSNRRAVKISRANFQCKVKGDHLLKNSAGVERSLLGLIQFGHIYPLTCVISSGFTELCCVLFY
jgi:hypothetical protein